MAKGTDMPHMKEGTLFSCKENGGQYRYEDLHRRAFVTLDSLKSFEPTYASESIKSLTCTNQIPVGDDMPLYDDGQTLECQNQFFRFEAGVLKLYPLGTLDD